MRRSSFATLIRFLIFGCMMAVALLIAVSTLTSRTGRGASTASTSVQDVGSVPPAPQDYPIVPTITPFDSGVVVVRSPVPSTPSLPPPPLPTSQPGVPTLPPVNTPTVVLLTVTPPPAVLQPLQVQIPPVISSIPPSSNAAPPTAQTISVGQQLYSWAWAPTGDKLVYVTNSSALYWSNADGSNPTLLHQYGEFYDQLEEQRPLGSSLMVRHLGALNTDGYSRQPTHMDVIRFTPGQPPTLTESPPLAHAPIHLHWWAANRVSGIAHADYIGGDLLVTLDENGNLVEERNIPYIRSGAVQPGGEWLAYVTGEQTSNVQFVGATPKTAYLLNLRTGVRLQISESGKGSYIGPWSPDGKWFLLTTASAVFIVSTMGTQAITMPDGSADAVWSPDSQRLAYVALVGQSTDGNNVVGWASEFHLIKLPTFAPIPTVDLRESGLAASQPGIALPDATHTRITTGLVMQPRWSPNGSTLGVLSFDPNCQGAVHCSGINPAIYLYPAQYTFIPLDKQHTR